MEASCTNRICTSRTNVIPCSADSFAGIFSRERGPLLVTISGQVTAGGRTPGVCIGHECRRLGCWRGARIGAASSLNWALFSTNCADSSAGRQRRERLCTELQALPISPLNVDVRPAQPALRIYPAIRSRISRRVTAPRLEVESRCEGKGGNHYKKYRSTLASGPRQFALWHRRLER